MKEDAQKNPDAQAEEEEPSPLEDLARSEEEEIKELHDRLLRVSAEFENYKKRTKREIEEFKKYANESVMKDLLPVVDNLERAVESARKGGKRAQFLEGVELTLKEILRVLERYGVHPLASEGQPFDPSVHQAFMAEESEHPEDTVIREMQKGYMMKDRLLRPSMVVVSKPAAKKE
ncbi:MAG: nucleotide exchange factor GrpE [Deltaproteobacteria bacterium]|nr:nucleotide exchange factor GrpE [Deltaproteobacteria bacterium]